MSPLSETGEMRSPSRAMQLVDSLAQAGITADDLVVGRLRSTLASVRCVWKLVRRHTASGVATDLVCTREAVPTPVSMRPVTHRCSRGAMGVYLLVTILIT